MGGKEKNLCFTERKNIVTNSEMGYHKENSMKFPHERHGKSMSLKKYEAFVQTVRLGSLTRAAEALGSTQSRISHILRDLEEEYGFELMERNRGGIRLTEAGAMILPKMEDILQKEQELEQLLEDIRSANAGSVRLGAFTSVAVHWLPGMIRVFEQAHPKAELAMFNGDYHDIEQWLQSGDIDLGFVTLPAPKGVRTIPLLEDPLVAILPKGHRLAALESIPIDEFNGEPFISLLQSSAHDFHRALDKAGVKPNIKFTTKDDYAILAMVEQGLGVSIVPELLLRGRRENLVVRPLEPQAARTIALAIPEGSALPVVEAFAQTAVEWVKEHG